mgnify:CR=1 FL=1
MTTAARISEFPIDDRITFITKECCQFREGHTAAEKIGQIIAQYPDNDVFLLHDGDLFPEGHLSGVLTGYDDKIVCTFHHARGDIYFTSAKIGVDALRNVLMQ